jgi:hypothetical protein
MVVFKTAIGSEVDVDGLGGLEFVEGDALLGESFLK